MDNKFYVTDAGAAAEREALTTGRQIKIATCRVDSTLLSELSDPKKLTNVQSNPTDHLGAKAIYPVSGESFPDRVVITWKLPKESGGYNVNGLGFFLEDGTMWGYQRMQTGWKPDPTEGHASDVHGSVIKKTTETSHITFDFDLTKYHATVNDIQFFIQEHHKILVQQMRKIEGKLGKVRLYMNLDDVDEGYLPIRGQLLRKADYPDYFEYLGVTSDTLRLPDWSLYPYLRQYSNQFDAGQTLIDEIRSHNHNGRVHAGGRHTPTGNPINIGNRSGSITLNQRFWTNTTGNHYHDGYTSYDGEHNHGIVDGNSNSGQGNGTDSTWQNAGDTIWTSSAGRHRHSFKTNYNGNHNHYTDVNFGTKTVNINIGTVHFRINEVPDHTHGLTIDHNGSSENRPKSTVVVYAVKVKYITELTML